MINSCDIFSLANVEDFERKTESVKGKTIVASRGIFGAAPSPPSNLAGQWNMPETSVPRSELISLAKAAEAAGKLTPAALVNLSAWLTEPRYAEFAPQVAEHIQAGNWQELDNVFWTVIPFGTGGRRGRMYPIGSNAINDRTIGESAQGLADYVKSAIPAGPWSCAIAYDPRHNSRRFAELCAEVMVAAGFEVFFLEEIRSTPELSFTVRQKKCACGIMVTASHNPPSDNAVKVYWSTGGQVMPPHDKGIIERVMSAQKIERTDFEKACAAGKVHFVKDEIDPIYQAAVLSQKFSGPRQLKLIYSPLHGVGATGVIPVLAQDGFTEVELYEPHSKPDGDFPNVPGHVSNPENAIVFTDIIVRAKETGAELILATDPDSDRLGAASPKTRDVKGDWHVFTGNQIAALLCDFVLERRKKESTLGANNWVITTLVTSGILQRLAESYGIGIINNLPVGYKWICAEMDKQGADRVAFSAEESHGYLVGSYARDKDGVVACMLMAELAASLKAEGKTLYQKLEALYWQHGFHYEKLINIGMEGSAGMARMKSLMERFRNNPPATLGGLRVTAIRDYETGIRKTTEGQTSKLDGPKADLIFFDLDRKGNYIAARPSGTEPKVKFYVFTFRPAEDLHSLEETERDLAELVKSISVDLQKIVDATA
jgi:phosphomannomutase